MLRIKCANATALSLAVLAALVTMGTTVTEAFSVQRLELSNQQVQSHEYTPLGARPKSKWDLLEEDDDEEDDMFYSSGAIESAIPVAPDMTYVERNVKRAHEHFLSLRNIGGKDVCHDVYAKSPLAEEEVWYVGKVAKISDVSLEDCIARQWNLIEIHATNLRPIELYPHRGKLELWTAPGDTELDIAYNRPEVKLTKMENFAVAPDQLKNNRVGFQGEVYQEGEEGFRSWRKADGSPARPEISPGGETRAPTEEEMEQLLKDTQRQPIDIEDCYDAELEKDSE